MTLHLCSIPFSPSRQTSYRLPFAIDIPDDMILSQAIPLDRMDLIPEHIFTGYDEPRTLEPGVEVGMTKLLLLAL
jgi:hypothetical protein